MSNLTHDDHFKTIFSGLLDKGYDCVFSFDYFPLISEVCMDRSLPYISWVYDSPHYTLESLTLGNPCNHVFVFDYALTLRYREIGIDTVDYMPLACNIGRLNRICSPHMSSPKHDVTFLGSLYNDSNNLYDRINYLPPYLKGYLDAIIASQEQIYGMDLVSVLMTDEVCKQTAKYVKASLGDGYRPAENEILRNMLRKKVTENERANLLRLLGDRFSVDLYAPAKPPKDIRVNFKGYADYHKDMPVIFASSKINLNITLRSILSGIPLRVIDILGAGGFLLTNYQSELPEYFEYGKDIVWYESSEDLIDKTDYYLEHEDERSHIIQNGLATVKREFSYDVLLPRIFEGI
jgi:spore maturation protein CgeB